MTLSINAQQIIRISTDKTDLVYQVNEKNRVYQVYLGEKLLNPEDYKLLKWNVRPGNDGSMSIRGHEAYPASGGEDYFEPAVAITHADGNPTSYLYYKGSEQRGVSGGTETIIRLADDKYNDEVTLHYVAYPKENVIKMWSEITNREGKPITLWRYNSGMLYLKAGRYFLTEYHSDWAKEGQPETEELKYGKKTVDTKLGARANLLAEPFFELGLDDKPREGEGRVMLGVVGWTGNFQYTCEVDNTNSLRLIPGINPYASNYVLDNGETFTTPEFVFTLSSQGSGQASRDLHDWCRRYNLRDGMGKRMTLLNNWENTAFDFDQQKLASLMRDAKDLGVDMFLLDDGWFGNKYPRKDDHAGLGDWEATKSKLPLGIPGMVDDAKKAGVKFGIWIEPEMVNPKSKLYEKHPDWASTLPNRETYY